MRKAVEESAVKQQADNSLNQKSDFRKQLRRYGITAAAVTASALLQAFAMQTFLTPAQILSSGFTGVAVLIDKIASLYGLHFPTSLGMIALNLPVAAFCFKHIGRKFVIFSMIQVFLASFFLRFAHFTPLFDDELLNICFGGFAYGMNIVLALKGNASTAGTDFIALYVSNKTGKAIWQYVFVFNACMLCVFGVIFGWEYAGYSIMFQFISTKTIDSFYHRYKRVTLQITTHEPEKVVEEYVKYYRHGVSVMEGYGGYSRQRMALLHTVVSSYEVQDIVHLMKEADPKIIVNVLPTETFFGGFYQKPID